MGWVKTDLSSIGVYEIKSPYQARYVTFGLTDLTHQNNWHGLNSRLGHHKALVEVSKTIAFLPLLITLGPWHATKVVLEQQ